ncbi:MAG TPA: phosphatidylserine decarboxylase [Candidatus Thermoplasmatota archaeon]|nr:phosphatidylserine decarboxylase [Candidatus Thermoplasmatota archaeon]
MAFLARGTWHWVAAPLVAGALLVLYGRNVGVPVALGVALLLLGLLFLQFFRDPERPAAEGVACPADGVVTAIERRAAGELFVSIFMNVYNVHVNRAPLAGRVASRVHKPGSHVPAFRKDSERNERVEWAFETEHGLVRVTQIAGLLARRIVPYAVEGQRVEKGARIGIIRLASRVDVLLPPGFEAAVELGESVRAGSTTLARRRSP